MCVYYICVYVYACILYTHIYMCNTEQKTLRVVFTCLYLYVEHVTKIKRYEFEMEQGDMGTGRRMIYFN